MKDLRAERLGNQVRLAWTTPTETTDELPVKPPLSAEICRDIGSTASPAACTVVQHLAVRSGPGTTVDLLPTPLLADPVQLLRYRVRILNASARAADPSNVAFTAAGTAPPPVTGLRSLPSPEGTRILWQRETSPAAEVRLQRTAIQPPASPTPAAATPSKRTAQKNLSAITPVQLLASTAGTDVGGTLDPSGQRGITYSYVAWRVRSALVSGRPVTLRSPDSPPTVFIVQDTTPPATPTGLAVIVDGAAVDLSWEPDTEADLAGYWVERADVRDAQAPAGSESWQRLNQTPLSAPAYRDGPFTGVHALRYRVLAVDGTGNLSQPTPPQTVGLRSDPAR